MSDSAETVPDDDKAPSLLRRLAQFLRGDDAAAAIRESLEEVIEESERQNAALSAAERTMLANLLRFGELAVRDVMVPRADIVAVPEDATFNELMSVFREAQHSRLPIYRETLDDPIGLVHIRDVLALLEPKEDGSFRWSGAPLASVKREVLFVPHAMPLLDLLLKMQTTHTHLALVIDEYGGTDGLVSIEDIIEEIVGEIEDEHDEAAPQVRVAPDATIIADARTDLDSFKEQTGLTLATEETAEDIDTIGGLAVSALGRVPQRGEIITLPTGYEFEVLEADPRRVKRVRIRPPARPQSAASDETVE
jgi:CBS domain containing-hemolysin-like protein